MDYKNKYLKYKQKYFDLKDQIGFAQSDRIKQKYFDLKDQIGFIKGGQLAEMPQICFGTVQANLHITLPLAIAEGYRHIDCAEDYAIHNYHVGGYYNIIRNAISSIPRHELWITWKADNITCEKIKIIIDKIGCRYIDLFLVHHSCGTTEDFKEIKKARSENFIRYYGVSNCENLEVIKRLKIEHDIYANQIQARPQNGKIYGREVFDFLNFIQESNKLGVKIMLFGSISGIINLSDFSIIYDKLMLINKYYIQKYIFKTSNVLIVTSISGSTIKQNIDDLNKIFKSEDLLKKVEIDDIQSKLETLVLNFQ